MKIGICYTVQTPELTSLVESSLRQELGSQAVFASYADESILSETGSAGYVTAGAASRLVALYTVAISDGADVILNCCSSVGQVCDSMQDFARFTGVPIVRIDEEMCREAVRSAGRIGVLATLPSTLEPTRATILRVAREMGRRVNVSDGLVEGAFGLAPEPFKEKLCQKGTELSSCCDLLVLAQGSMAYAEAAVAAACGKPVLSSPRFGALSVRRALEAKGLLS